MLRERLRPAVEAERQAAEAEFLAAQELRRKKGSQGAMAEEDADIRKMKDIHALQLQQMVNSNVNEHAIASTAAEFGRREREAVAKLERRERREAEAKLERRERETEAKLEASKATTSSSRAASRSRPTTSTGSSSTGSSTSTKPTTAEDIRKMKETHAWQLQQMVDSNENEHAIAATGAAGFGRREREAEEKLERRERATAKACPICVLM